MHQDFMESDNSQMSLNLPQFVCNFAPHPLLASLRVTVVVGAAAAVGEYL
jgi:hypothetical protein